MNNWEHLLVGEPLIKRKVKKKDLDEEEQNDMYDEKHLDMPMPWSMKISIPHDGKFFSIITMSNFLSNKHGFENQNTPSTVRGLSYFLKNKGYQGLSTFNHLF